jgi:hypothetical protein
MDKDKERLIEALKEMPIVQIACKKAGVGRATYYRWRKEDMSFLKLSDEALTHGIDFINDMSESQLITLIREKKMPAISLWLRHNHKRYGSTVRTYPYHPSASDLTEEENTIVLEALMLATGTTYHGPPDTSQTNTGE